MKTYKNLYPQIFTFPNLYRAFLAARKGKRDRVSVASFEFDLEQYPSPQPSPLRGEGASVPSPLPGEG